MEPNTQTNTLKALEQSSSSLEERVLLVQEEAISLSRKQLGAHTASEVQQLIGTLRVFAAALEAWPGQAESASRRDLKQIEGAWSSPQVKKR